MIIFITNKTDKYQRTFKGSDGIIVVGEEQGKDLINRSLIGKKHVALDLEATGLDAHRAKILLTGIAVNKNKFFVIDSTVDITFLVKSLETRVVIGHNIKYDIKLLKTNTGILLKKVYDTMIAEQRLYLGAKLHNGYADLVARYENTYLSKSVREDFIDANVDTFTVKYHHIFYLANDLKYLFSIKKKQKPKIHRFCMQYLLYGIEFPLISVLANAELRGFAFDTELWLSRVNRNIEEKYETLCKLDGIVRNLRDTLPDVKRELLVGGKFNKVRKRNKIVDLINTNGTVEVEDLFGNKSSAIDLFKKTKSTKTTKTAPKVDEYPGCIKYTKQEVIHIFCALNQPAITEFETFSIPTYYKDKLNFNTYSIKSDMLSRYLVLRPNTPLKEFLLEFNNLQKINKTLSTYGKTFIDKINEITGHIHTQFGQCFTDTGRMSSGGGKKETDKYNAQNIPRDKDIRNAFRARPGYLIDTADYSGAELIVMASHAQDFRLLELSKGDMHSHFATKGWRAIYKYRAKKELDMLTLTFNNDKSTYSQLLETSTSFTVTKDEPKGYRTAYKPIAFGTIYGAYPKKIAQVLNINVDEAKYVIASVKKEIPKTFAMVESKSALAEKYGYVIHNNRTNSRRWFPNLIKQLKGEINKDTHFLDISEELSAARNTTIQGTQADFVKEASVKLQYYFWKKDIDSNILSWIHDEIVTEVKEEIAEEVNAVKKKIMIETANLYLKNVTIDAETVILPYWTK